jgi:addiction module RelE/StbE family toxin
MWTIQLSRQSVKELEKSPKEIQVAFEAWRHIVEASGPEALRLINGYWDHALKGEWAGARASSLNKSWRVIYVVQHSVVTVSVVRISHHDYRR